jgi:hypothetical protein
MANQGKLATPVNPDVLNGCDTIIKINDKEIGFGKNVEIDENVNQTPIEAIGYWRPRGFKSLKWDGNLTMELHILTQEYEGIIDIDTSNCFVVNQPYTFVFIHKTTRKVVADAVGLINTRGFSLNHNEPSGQRVAFVLIDIKYREAFN